MKKLIYFTTKWVNVGAYYEFHLKIEGKDLNYLTIINSKDNKENTYHLHTHNKEDIEKFMSEEGYDIKNSIFMVDDYKQIEALQYLFGEVETKLKPKLYINTIGNGINSPLKQRDYEYYLLNFQIENKGEFNYEVKIKNRNSYTNKDKNILYRTILKGLENEGIGNINAVTPILGIPNLKNSQIVKVLSELFFANIKTQNEI